MTCGSMFHGQHGDDTPPEDMFVDDSPTNLDGDGYPFPMPSDAPTDPEVAEWEYPGIGDVLSVNMKGIRFAHSTPPLLHTHAPGYDATSETIKDHLRLAHLYLTGGDPWETHARRHPEGII